MAWKILFTSDVGLLSLFTIVFMVVMAAYVFRFVVRHVKEEEGRAQLKNAPPAH